MVARQSIHISFAPDTYREGFAEELVADANHIYRVSKIPIDLELVGTSHFAVDSHDSRLLLQAFAPQNDADISVLISGAISLCGRAYFDCGRYPDPSECSRAVVHTHCALDYHTFTHEIGHIQGANHDARVPWPLSRTGYNYGHVFGRFRTIMSTDTSRTRIPIFSNPRVKYEGVPTGVRGVSNNVKAITNTRFEIGHV